MSNAQAMEQEVDRLSEQMLARLNDKTSFPYIWALSERIEDERCFGSDLETCLDLIHRMLNRFNYNVDNIEPIIARVLLHLPNEPLAVQILHDFHSCFKEDAFPFLATMLHIYADNDVQTSCYIILRVIFECNPNVGAESFRSDHFTKIINLVNADYDDTRVIQEKLLLLAAACLHPDVEQEIKERFSGFILATLKHEQSSVRIDSAFVIAKLRDTPSFLSKAGLKYDDLVDIFVGTPSSKYSLEGLSYISTEKSVKIKLRSDSEFISDIVQQLQDSSAVRNGSAIAFILSNLTELQDEDEVSELEEGVQKLAVGEEVEENQDDIKQFNKGLLEKNIIWPIWKLYANTDEPRLKQIASRRNTRLIDHLTRDETLNQEVLDQGGLDMLLGSLRQQGEFNDIKEAGLKILLRLLLTTDIKEIFKFHTADTSVKYLLEILDIKEFKQEDKNKALLLLTKLSKLDLIALTEKQWESIDVVLSKDDPLQRRSAIEIVSNLAQKKDELPSLFNLEKPNVKKRFSNLLKSTDGLSSLYKTEKPVVRKRFNLIVQYLLLDDVESQRSAIKALSYGVTFPLIAEGILKSEQLVNNLTTIISDEKSDSKLLEGAIFVLYHLVVNGKKSDVVKSLGASTKLKEGITRAQSANVDTKTKEKAKEIAKLVKFK